MQVAQDCASLSQPRIAGVTHRAQVTHRDQSNACLPQSSCPISNICSSAHTRCVHTVGLLRVQCRAPRVTQATNQCLFADAFSSFNSERKEWIDFIWYSEDTYELLCSYDNGSAKCRQSIPDQTHGSDHLPITARFALRREAVCK